MGLLDDVVAKVTDPYERQARLYPALLALLPLFVVVMLLYAPNAPTLTRAVTVAVSCGALYLMTNLCRELGKRVEEKLFRGWGGKPTTQLLRHRDGTIEPPTKKRYHAFLAAKVNEAFPDALQEEQDPAKADGLYQAGVRWLLNHTRPDDTKKFDLLFKENVPTAFVGMDWASSRSACLSAWLASFGFWQKSMYCSGRFGRLLTQRQISRLPDTATATLAVSVVMVLVWTFFFTKETVRSIAITYAEMLLRTCDVL